MVKKAIIIGGGPAGLTAAYEFINKTNITPIVIEQSEYWGGISRTVNYKGNRIDIGGHRFFSKSDVIMEWWSNILPIESDNENLKISYQNSEKTFEVKNNKNLVANENVMIVRSRKSRIYYKKQFFDYPIALTPNTILKLGIFNTMLIGFSYFKSVLFPIKEEKNLEDFFINRFGTKLYKTFFKDYTEKVWGVKCTEISAEWGAQRIKGLSILKSISHFVSKKISFYSKKDISQKNTETSLIEYFLYPKYGPGQMWEEVAKKIEASKGQLHQNSKVIKLNSDANKIISIEIENQITKEIEVLEGDYFISTMPVKELINAFENKNIPKTLKNISDGLQYRDFITVGLLLDKMKIKNVTDNWIYIQEPYVKVGRLQIFNNWSPFMVNDPSKVWVGLEYFCYENDEIWNLSEEKMKLLAIEELYEIGFIEKEDVMDSIVIKMPKTYPAYFGTYKNFNEIIEFTNKYENLFLIGRNGMHKYNNQDHSMLTAIQTVQNIINNSTSKSNIWSINTEQEYHEKK